MDQYGMLDNIRAHSLRVSQVARLIGNGLRKAGVRLSLDLVTAGALMHDIAKSLCLGKSEDHAAMGMEICVANDLREIADIVGEHIRLKNFSADDDIKEKEIVYYADKRVNDDRVVSLEERLDYLIERYAGDQNHLEILIRKNFTLCRRVEEKIFNALDFSPRDVAGMIK
jgi:putative nucleotidyltransferase with HDIG domain